MVAVLRSLWLLVAALAGYALAVEECGDGYYCTHVGAYGCAKLPMSQGNPMVCCSIGERLVDCTQAGGGKPLPYCPAGGATGTGCSRYMNAATRRDGHLSERQTTLTEECGDGYACTMNGRTYGCAAEPLTVNSTLVCCSAGQPEYFCKEASQTSTPLPYCPAGGATGGGCVRAEDAGQTKQTAFAVRGESDKEAFEEECGEGYTCVATIAYGCAKLPVTKNFTMVCCSQGVPLKYCAESSPTSEPLPYCPAGGATGAGCLRLARDRGADNQPEQSDSRTRTQRIQ